MFFFTHRYVARPATRGPVGRERREADVRCGASAGVAQVGRGEGTSPRSVADDMLNVQMELV